MGFLLVSISIITISCVGTKTSVPQNVKDKQVATTNYHKVDPQGSVYQVKNETVYKYDSHGNVLFTYSDKSLGNINTIDVSNPLRPLFFYKDLQLLVITDNTLSVHNRQFISFDELGLYQVQMVASSRMDNGVWLYDQGTFQLKKMSQNWEVLYQSGNLEQLLGKKAISPQMMIENNGYLYLVCSNNGILIFDMYGAYFKSIPLLDVDFFFPAEQFIYLVQGDKISGYHLKTHETVSIELTQSLGAVFGFFDQHFYGWLDGKIAQSTFTFKE
jgi:hypothetical protein